MSATKRKRVVLIRHGQTDYNKQRLLQGHKDIALNDFGREQARSVQKRIRTFSPEKIFSSDLIRASETAEILRAGSALPIVKDARLRERFLGKWEGMSIEKLESENKAEWHQYRNGDGSFVPGESGETAIDHRRRIDDFFETVKQCSEERILVVTHGGSLVQMFAYIIGAVAGHSPRVVIPNCAYNSFEIDEVGVKLSVWGQLDD